jgi:glycogenin
MTPSSTVPTTSALSLEDLRRIAIEGFSGITGISGTSVAPTSEGNYISLPLEGRLDLMRPRPGPEKGRESSASAGGQRVPGDSVGDQPTSDDHGGLLTPKPPPSSFYTGDLSHHPDSGPLGPSSVRYFSLEPSATMPSDLSPFQLSGTQPAAAARWQTQPGPSSSLPQDRARSYFSAGPSRPQPHSIDQWTPSRIGPEYPQGTSDRQAWDLQGSFTRLPAGTYLEGLSEYSHTQRQFSLPSEQNIESIVALSQPAQTNEEALGLPYQPGQPLQSAYQLTQRLPQAYNQAQDPQQFYVQGQKPALNLGPKQTGSEQGHFVHHDTEHVRERGHQQAPLPEEPARPASPPLVVWNPAVEPPPKTAPVSNFPPSTYYPNVWDQSPSHRQSDWSPSQDTSSTLFTIPPPSRIPERLLHEKHYANILGESKQGESPSPDRTKIKPVFPWEDKPRLTPGRIFPSTDSPPPGQFLLPEKEAVSPSPSPPLLRFSPTQSYMSSPPSGFPPSFSYTNAWDVVPSIQQYASRLVRPPPNIPPLAPAFDYGESRRRESALFRNRHESGESSVDGDDEDTEDEGKGAQASKPRSRSGSSVMASQPYYGGKGKKKEYRSQGVQTIPKETRNQSVQVTIITDPADADRSIKDKGKGPPRSRQSSYSGVSPTLEAMQRDLSPSSPTAPGPQGFGTSYTDDVQKLSPLNSPTGLRSPRYASPRGSSTNLAESTPRPTLYRPAQGLSTPQRGGVPQRLLPTSLSRTISSDTASSPSSVGPPISPEDTRPMRGIGGRVWDPARRVEIFKKGSEEVLSRFLKMGSWEEEKQSQSPTA